MTISNLVDAELALLEKGASSSSGPYLVQLDVSLGMLEFELTEVDSMAVNLNYLQLSTSGLAAVGTEELKQVGHDLAERLIYLLEPIAPIEIDSEGATIQMRSNPPRQDDDGTRYYELLVRQSGLSLRRYVKIPGAVRQGVAGQVTKDVMGRLATDFVATVENR